MKHWLKYCPGFVSRLWFQLAFTYTLLAICAFAVLVMIMYGFNDYKDFYKTLAPSNVETRVLSEKLTVTQAVQQQDHTEWRDTSLNNIRKKLINLEQDDDTIEIYRITNSSNPEVYMRIIDATGRTLVSDPAIFPPAIADSFASPPHAIAQGHAGWLAENQGPIWMDMPITDSSGDAIGHLQLLYIAEFDWWVQLGSIISFMIVAFDWVIIISVPIGLACGLIASRYVTRQLQKMNAVTASWRQGNFEARIELPNDDVLIRHSQHLNDMAQDLEMYLNLKQSLAVTDERTRVARELHDTVKQKLFALGLQLATAKANPAVIVAAGEHILEAETITREAQHDLMEIITQLRPTGTGEISFYDRIGMIADDFKRRFGVQVDIIHADMAQFSSHSEHQVLRIVQEALINAVRHGEASDIVITNKVERDIITLSITDNGKGFDVDKKTGGFGITSMRDRAHDLPHGTFIIKSSPSTGTQITLSWKNES